jgi:hypothetical protein
MKRASSAGNCFDAGQQSVRITVRCAAAGSDKDFIATLGIVIEEADETAFWLELLVEAAIVTAAVAKSIWREADELTRIFVSSRETARRNRRLKRRRGQTTKSKIDTNNR